jgi:hypothetical protein
MNDLNDLINLYNISLNNNTNIELELTYHFKSYLIKNVYKDLFNKLKNKSLSMTIEESIHIYYNKYKNIKYFKNGVNLQKDTNMIKKQLSRPIKVNINNDNIIYYNLKLNEEYILNDTELDKLKKSDKNIKLIKLKYRITFLLKEFPKFKFDLDLIKNIDIKQNNIKEIKNKIFKEYNINSLIEDINYDLFDEILLETEILNNLTISEQELLECIEFITDSNNNIYSYQSYIYNIASYIISNKYYLEDFKSKSGLKKLLNNVIELNIETYCKQVQPQIEHFYVTDKIDGKRCIIYIEEYENLLNIKLLTNKLIQIEEYNNNLDNKKSFITILDSESIIQNDSDVISINDIKLYIFDIIAYKNQNVSSLPFEKRLDFISKGYSIISMIKSITCKEYIKLTNTYQNDLTAFYNKTLTKTDYETDGLIFVPTSKVIIPSSKYSKNTNYNNMVGYKWKPHEHITIDFYIKKLPKSLYKTMPYKNLKLTDNDIIYILFSGISKFDYHKLNLTYMTNYNKIISDKYNNLTYFPIQFSTSDNPNNYIYISNQDNLDHTIGEFNFDLPKNKWILKKIRLDRTVELERGEYFGNYYKIAELIWNNIKNPLTFDLLLSKCNSYFLQDDNQFYKAQRAYNSFVKTYLLEAITNENISDFNHKNWIIDLAAGKGQDLARINNIGFKNGLFIDNDANALIELLNRKYNLKLNNNVKQMKIFTQNIDLSIEYSDIIKQLDKFEIAKESVDVIVCNFALHYIIKNDINLNNIVKLLFYYLKPNGRFIYTCFNGLKIFNLLQNTNQWDIFENNMIKYSIKKNYTSKTFLSTGQKIDVLLPFSNNNYYTEYLMNIEYINSYFTDNKFSIDISDSFSNLLDKYTPKNSEYILSEEDKQYIDLYQFTIIKKNYNNNIVIKSNLLTLFNKPTQKSEITGSNNINSDHYMLSQLDNIDNSNRILLIINNTDESIIKNIIALFEDFNYKNNNTYKRHKNKIIKVVSFNGNKWVNIYNNYKECKYSSIIFYNFNSDVNENIKKYLIKNPILPIFIQYDNEFILVINNNDIENKSNLYEIYTNINKFITNIPNPNINILPNNDESKEIKKIVKKYYDLIE